jgi:hypothetical protein
MTAAAAPKPEKELAPMKPKRKHRATGKPVGRPKGVKDGYNRHKRTEAEILAAKEGLDLGTAATLLKERAELQRESLNTPYLPDEEDTREKIRFSGGDGLSPSDEFIWEILAMADAVTRADEISEIVATICTFDQYAHGDAMHCLVEWMRGLTLINGGWAMQGEKGTLAEKISFMKKLTSAESKRKKWLASYDEVNEITRWTPIPPDLLPNPSFLH